MNKKLIRKTFVPIDTGLFIELGVNVMFWILAVATVADVEGIVRSIEKIADDDERAHAMEDDLHVAVMLAIAEGRAADPVAMCAAALRTRNIKFARHCA